jgi:hypothetical protein
MMLKVSDGGKSCFVGFAALAGAGSSARPRPSETFAASSSSMFNKCETTRLRMSGRSTLLSSNVKASPMCFCSMGVWLR